MKKYWIIALAALCVTSTTWASPAPDREGVADVGLHIWGILPSDSAIDTNVYVGGSVAYGINPNWALGLESGYFQTNADLNIAVANVSGDIGDLQGVPLFFDIIYRHTASGGPVTPYTVLGLGAVFWRFDENTTVREANSGVDADPSFAAKLGLGVDWFLTDNVIFNFEGSYVWTPEEITTDNNTGTTVDKSDLNYFTLGGGIKYAFS